MAEHNKQTQKALENIDGAYKDLAQKLRKLKSTGGVVMPVEFLDQAIVRLRESKMWAVEGLLSHKPTIRAA